MDHFVSSHQNPEEVCDGLTLNKGNENIQITKKDMLPCARNARSTIFIKSIKENA